MPISTAEADRVFARLLKEFPSGPHAADARFNLAESANLARNYPEVVRLLTPLAAIKPVDGKPKRRDADPGQDRDPISDRRSLNRRRLESLRRLLPAVLYRLGRTQVELKDWAAAAVTLDRLLTEFPDNPYRREAQYLRSEAALRNGDAGTAEKGFAALLDEHPGCQRSRKGMVPAVRLEADSVLGRPEALE